MSPPTGSGHRSEINASGSALGWMYDAVTGDEDARVCKDIPDESCRDQPLNFFAYLGANLLGKIGDELASARLVLPWILGALGAPAAFTGFLVPIREGGVLLPQLVVAAYIRRLARRKRVWLFGAALTAFSLGLMAIAAGTTRGAAAGTAIVGLLVVYSVARGLCSVSAKDVLGKTVSKTRRGALMGYSAGIAGAATLALGLGLSTLSRETDQAVVFMALLIGAALLWLGGIAFFAAIREAAGATEGGGNAVAVALDSLALLIRDLPFRRFVIARALLLSVALAPPFYVLLAQDKTAGSLGSLGLLVIVNGLASSLSAPLLGRLGDRSSRAVIAGCAALAGLAGVLTWGLVRVDAAAVHQPLGYGLLFLTIAVAHSGVRLGRKVYLVDMATTETRSAYVAVSNTVIGVAMLVGGLFGILGDLFDPSAVLLLLGLLSFVAALYAWRLPDVSG